MKFTLLADLFVLALAWCLILTGGENAVYLK